MTVIDSIVKEYDANALDQSEMIDRLVDHVLKLTLDTNEAITGIFSGIPSGFQLTDDIAGRKVTKRDFVYYWLWERVIRAEA